MDINIIWASGFGIIFLITSIVLAIKIPTPTPFQILVFRTVLALSAGGAAATIPGFLNIETDLPRLVIRAGGGLAVFLLIYRFNPVRLVMNSNTVIKNIHKIDKSNVDNYTKVIFKVKTKPDSKTAQLLGNFTAWEKSPIDMDYMGDCVFQTEALLEKKQRFEFKFKIDGKWKEQMNDEYKTSRNSFGTLNYVVFT